MYFKLDPGWEAEHNNLSQKQLSHQDTPVGIQRSYLSLSKHCSPRVEWLWQQGENLHLPEPYLTEQEMDVFRTKVLKVEKHLFCEQDLWFHLYEKKIKAKWTKFNFI